MDTVKKADEKRAGVLAQPARVDREWEQRIETAKRARAAALQARRGKPTSFRPVSGYHAP